MVINCEQCGGRDELNMCSFSYTPSKAIFCRFFLNIWLQLWWNQPHYFWNAFDQTPIVLRKMNRTRIFALYRVILDQIRTGEPYRRHTLERFKADIRLENLIVSADMNMCMYELYKVHQQVTSVQATPAKQSSLYSINCCLPFVSALRQYRLYAQAPSAVSSSMRLAMSV